MNIDISQLDPRRVRPRPRLPSPAWALVFVSLALLNLWLSLSWLHRFGPAQPSSALVWAIQRDVALGVLLGIILMTSYQYVKERTFALAVLAAVLRDRPHPRLRLVNWLGTLGVAVLYGATFLPLVLGGSQGVAGRSLMSVPLDIAAAWVLWDLRSYHRAAWEVITRVLGILPPWEERRRQAERLEQQVLDPAQVRERPRWQYNLTGLLALIQGVLLAVGAVSVFWGWPAGYPSWLGVPREAWTYGLGGLGIGLWGSWHESRALRGHERTLAVQAVLRQKRAFPFYVWEWWGYTVILAAVIAALAGLTLMGELQIRLAGGALSLGYGIGVTPLHRPYAQPWRLAWELIRETRRGPLAGKQER